MSRVTPPRDHAGRAIDFGRTAADYERHRPGFPDSFFTRLETLGWMSPRMRALDLGTGTGSLALAFAAHGLRTSGLDISAQLLAVARDRAESRGLALHLVEDRAEATGLSDASFDLISAGQCWWWFDSDAVLREARRLLVPGGRLLICNFSYLPLPGSVAARTEALILEHNPGWTKAGWRGVHPEQVRALDEAGFADVESFSYTVDLGFSHEAWRGRMRTCNGVGSALGTDEVEAFDDALARMLSADFPGELTVAHRVFAVSGVTPSA